MEPSRSSPEWERTESYDSLADALEDAPTCRLCWSQCDDAPGGELIEPCRCAGSQRYIHSRCLSAWQNAQRAQGRISKAKTCEICRHRYHARRRPEKQPARGLVKVASDLSVKLAQVPLACGSATWPHLVLTAWKWYILANGLAEATAGGLLAARSARLLPTTAAAPSAAAAAAPQAPSSTDAAAAAIAAHAAPSSNREAVRMHLSALLKVTTPLVHIFGGAHLNVLYAQTGGVLALVLASERLGGDLLGAACGALSGLVSGYANGMRNPLHLLRAAAGGTARVALRLPGLLRRLLPRGGAAVRRGGSGDAVAATAAAAHAAAA